MQTTTVPLTSSKPLPEGWHLVLRAIVGGGPATPVDSAEVPVSVAGERIKGIVPNIPEVFRRLCVESFLSFYGSGEKSAVSISPRGARALLEHETAKARAAMLPAPERARADVGPAEVDSCPGCGADFPDVVPVFTVRLQFVGVQLCQECVRAILPAARTFALQDHAGR